MDDILQKTVDGEYEIQPNITVYLDGGTVSCRIKNGSGDTHQLYLDRRIRTETKDVFYKDEHPGQEDSVQLGRNDALVAKIEATLKSEANSAKTE